MSLLKFVNAIQEGGRLRVSLPDETEVANVEQELEPAILELDARTRLEVPMTAPPLRMAVSVWAARMLHRACQCLVYREVAADAIQAALAQPCPEPLSPAACYSADLLLQHLPEVCSLAKGIAEGDPLVAGLLVLAAEWPLSSVGIRGAVIADIGCFIDDPCLRRLYADRIIQRQDPSRLNDARAREAVREALGMHLELAPAVASALESVGAMEAEVEHE